jgi:hypothetical protein
MSTLHQIQLRYDAVEDRALLRISTTGTSEFRFWVTRRYAGILRRALHEHLGHAARTAAHVPAERQHAMLDFQRDAALATSDFKTGYVDDTQRSTPLGEAPVLLARVGLTRQTEATVLAMHPLRGQGIEIRLNDTMIHSLLKLLDDAARAGDWALPAAAPETAAPAAPSRMN